MVVSFRPFILLVVLAIASSARLSAQSSTAEPGQTQTPSTEGMGTSAEKDQPENTDLSVKSLVDRLFARRNRMGLAFGVTEFYTPDTLIAGSNSRSGSFTSANSSLYANFGRSKSQFHIDYTVQYQRDNRQLNLSGLTQGGSLSWSRVMGRRGSLSVRDSFIAAPNDEGASFRLSDPLQFPYVSTQEIFVDRQKITRNVLAISSGYQIGKRTTVDFFASDELTHYQHADFGQTQIIQAGLGASHQLTKFLFIQTSYTSFLNAVNPIYQNVTIQRLRALTFRFHRRRIDVSTSGGIQYAKNPGSKDIVAEAEAGVTIGSRPNVFSLQYDHGLTSIIGAGTAVEADTMNGFLRHWISNRFSVGLNSVYVRYAGGNGSQKSGLESLAAGVGIQLALTSDVILSINHNYVSQTSRGLAFDAPQLHRYASSAGITYMLPAFRVR